jgi:hypothetical protein
MQHLFRYLVKGEHKHSYRLLKTEFMRNNLPPYDKSFPFLQLNEYVKL